MDAIEERFIHYWTGYGNLCMSADGRRPDAKSIRVVGEVTCPACVRALWQLGKIRPTPPKGSNHEQ